MLSDGIGGRIFHQDTFYISTGGFNNRGEVLFITAAAISCAIASVFPVPLQYAISTIIESSLCYDELF